jgi:hypothetical protein
MTSSSSRGRRLMLWAVWAPVLLLGLAYAADRAAHAPQRCRAELQGRLAELARLIQAEDVRVDEVSGWSVHEHVEHVLLAHSGITGMITSSEEPDTVESLSWMGRMVLASGYIPRGKGQSPPEEVRDTLEQVTDDDGGTS